MQAINSQALAKLKAGDIVSATVTHLEDYGVFVELKSPIKSASLQGMVHKSELSWDTILTVDQVAKLGQQLKLKVLDVDAVKCRLNLSLKQMQQDPLRENIDSLKWHKPDPVAVIPAEVQQIVDVLREAPGITDVRMGRQVRPHMSLLVIGGGLYLWYASGTTHLKTGWLPFLKFPY